tara:strand:+ start:191 stop:379 length:189 start_codon:yes stop_codon:yes gene_type:complete
MTKKDIIKLLSDARLETHERESLQQLLHYLEAEGLNSTTTTNNNNNNNKSKHTKHKHKHKRQ